MAVPVDPERREAYRELAERLEDASDREVWEGFGQRMAELTQDTDAAFAGYAMAISHELVGRGDDLGTIIGIGYRQFGSSREGLKQNAIARNADVYAVRPADAGNPTGAARYAVVQALEDAAERDGESDE